jgi:hypothetical protein
MRRGRRHATWLESCSAPALPEPDRAATYDMLDAVEARGRGRSRPDGEYDLVDPATLAKDLKLPRS